MHTLDTEEVGSFNLMPSLSGLCCTDLALTYRAPHLPSRWPGLGRVGEGITVGHIGIPGALFMSSPTGLGDGGGHFPRVRFRRAGLRRGCFYEQHGQDLLRRLHLGLQKWCPASGTPGKEDWS